MHAGDPIPAGAGQDASFVPSDSLLPLTQGFICCFPLVGPAVTVSTPPAVNRLAANEALAVCAASGPNVARKTGPAAG